MSDDMLDTNSDAESSLAPSVYFLPDEILLHILEYLTPAELAKVAMVSRRFNVVASHEPTWKNWVDLRFGMFHADDKWSSKRLKLYGVHSYRKLFAILFRVGDLEGHWRIASGDYMPRGTLASGTIHNGQVVLQEMRVGRSAQSMTLSLQAAGLPLHHVIVDNQTGVTHHRAQKEQLT
eukprot:m.336834 g.336834  ORF g.336834 m.336834 type:complete len:178 (-) comp20543_c0_seq3:1513-2046(-)